MYLYYLVRFFFFFIALNQTLPMFTKSICNKNISVILSFYTSFAMKETKGGEWGIFKIINFSKKQLFRINGEIKINRSAHIYIYFSRWKNPFILFILLLHREKKKKKLKSQKARNRFFNPVIPIYQSDPNRVNEICLRI